MPVTVPDARNDPLDLVSLEVFNTGPYVANGEGHTISWKNESGRALKVHRTYLWTGATYNHKADIHCEVRRKSDHTKLAMLQWDRYAEPNLPQHAQQFSYAPGYITILPDEELEMYYFSYKFAGTGTHQAHHVCEIWVEG